MRCNVYHERGGGAGRITGVRLGNITAPRGGRNDGRYLSSSGRRPYKGFSPLIRGLVETGAV